jgi:hypothetical protein
LEFFGIEKIIGGCENKKLPLLGLRISVENSVLENKFVKYPVYTFFNIKKPQLDQLTHLD